MKKLLSVATAAAMAIASQSAIASPYSNFYVFGDSLMDSGGNASRNPDLIATNAAGPTYQYSNGEPSGRISVEFIADNLGLALTGSEFGGTNYAVGAHRSADTLESISTLGGTYSAPAGEYNSYFYNLSLSGGSVDPNALYLLNGGGNDLGAIAGGDLTSYTQIANNLLASAEALINNGANYVVILDVPNFSISPTASVLPEFARDFITSAVLDQNEQLTSGVQALAGNVVLLNTYQFSQELFADPSAFGFSLSAAELQSNCFEPTATGCGGSSPEGNVDSANPNPDQFFFNDSLHFTTFGNMIFADYITSVLNAGSELSLLPELAIDAVQSQWQAARPTMRNNRWQTTDSAGQLSVYGTINDRENELDTDIASLNGENNNQSYHVGINYRANDNVYFGALLGRSDNELDIGLSSYEMDSTDISFLGGYSSESLFVEAIYTHSDNDYGSLDRSFSLGPVNTRTETGDTDGESSALAIQAGYDIFEGEKDYRFGPIIGYEYIDTTVGGYQEASSRSTSLIVADQNVSSSVLLAGAFASTNLNICDCSIYAEAIYRLEDNDDRNDVELGLVTVGSNRFTLPGQERDEDSVTIDVGFDATLTEALNLNLSAGTSDASNSEQAWLGATLSYQL